MVGAHFSPAQDIEYYSFFYLIPFSFFFYMMKKNEKDYFLTISAKFFSHFFKTREKIFIKNVENVEKLKTYFFVLQNTM